IFGTNALGLIIASQINRWLLNRYRGDAILGAALSGIAAAGLLLALVAATGIGGLAGLLLPLFFCIAGFGLVSPNSAAAAMAPHGVSPAARRPCSEHSNSQLGQSRACSSARCTTAPRSQWPE